MTDTQARHGVRSLPCGIGLRAPHAAELAASRQAVGFLEVHAENYFGDGGVALAQLTALRADYPVSLHGVGLVLGSQAAVCPQHLSRLVRLCERVEPRWVSEHAALGRAPWGPDAVMGHASDLLPLAFTHATLARLVRHVQQVQEALRRPLLIENLSAYLRWEEADLDEPDFFNELVRRSGCQLLLDVNNLVVNERNRAMPDLGEANALTQAARRAMAWVDVIDRGAVGEIHVAGHRDLGDLVVDDHGSRVSPAVWSVYRHAVARFGAVPSLVEWDTELPALSVLLEEAALADRHADEALGQGAAA